MESGGGGDVRMSGGEVERHSKAARVRDIRGTEKCGDAGRAGPVENGLAIGVEVLHIQVTVTIRHSDHEMDLLPKKNPPAS
jgi:hypothetical protein